MEEYIEEALKRGTAAPPHHLPLLGSSLWRKNGGGLRPCIDYQGLNQVMVKYCYPLPLVPAALRQRCETRIFTKLNLRRT